MTDVLLPGRRHATTLHQPGDARAATRAPATSSDGLRMTTGAMTWDSERGLEDEDRGESLAAAPMSAHDLRVQEVLSLWMTRNARGAARPPRARPRSTRERSPCRMRFPRPGSAAEERIATSVLEAATDAEERFGCEEEDGREDRIHDRDSIRAFATLRKPSAKLLTRDEGWSERPGAAGAVEEDEDSGEVPRSACARPRSPTVPACRSGPRSAAIRRPLGRAACRAARVVLNYERLAQPGHRLPSVDETRRSLIRPRRKP